MVYFRFRSAQKLTAPMILATATAAIIATSVVIKGVSGVGSGEGEGSGDGDGDGSGEGVGSGDGEGSGEGDGEGDGSGSIVPPDEGAGPTVTHVVADELP